MSKKTTQMDEMQEQKLLKIEHIGCWLAFFGLVIVIIAQALLHFDQANFMERVLGEFVLLFVLGAYLVFACLRQGIWDRKYVPNLKTNCIASAIAGGIAGLVQFTGSYLRYGKLLGSVATFLFVFLFTAALCLSLLSAMAALYRRRIKKLEQEPEELSNK